MQILFCDSWESIVNKLRGALKVDALKAPGFDERKSQYLDDIVVLTGASRRYRLGCAYHTKKGSRCQGSHTLLSGYRLANLCQTSSHSDEVSTYSLAYEAIKLLSTPKNTLY